MAQKPDGKAAKTERVTFTRPAAERIASAVRKVETGGRDALRWAQSPRFVSDGDGKVFRVGTFTGSWNIGTLKVVTLKSNTNRTTEAVNLFWPVPDGPERDCAIAKDGTAWYLVVPQLYAANAATAATLTTTTLEFKTLPVVALATESTATFSVAVSTCATATSSP